MTVTSHDLAQLAFIRSKDPKLAMALATAAGKQNDNAIQSVKGK